MKRFIVKTTHEFFPYYFFVCKGDEYSRCDKCRGRFGCYTGELPSNIIKKYLRTDESVEEYLFGSFDLYLVECDYEKHSAV